MFALIPIQALAQPKYDPGATGAEIKIGNIMPYTGAFSEYGATGRAEAAYFQMVNDQGGVNGRKIKFISLDSGSDTNKATPHFPWTVRFQASKRTEGLAYTRYILQNKPRAKVAILYASDPSGQEWLQGIREGLGAKAQAMI
jgi:ABC-type branched-subunit amino acid transport system substrate-binding protein